MGNISFWKIFLFFPIALLGFFIIGFSGAYADKIGIRINEVQVTGGTGKTNNDFIELYNSSLKEVILDGWKLRKKTSSGAESSIRVFPAGSTVGPGEYFLWANTSDGFNSEINANVSSSSTVSEGNIIYLMDAEEKLIDSIECMDAKEKRSLSYDKARDTWEWVLVGTPGSENKFDSIPSPSIKTLRLSEVFPDPKEVSDSEGEFVEIYNFGTDSVNLSSWKIIDKNGKKELSGDISPKEYKAFYKTVSLNNSDEVISLVAPDEEEVDSIEYADSQEGWSYALDATVWRWTPEVTPNAKNRFPESSRNVKVYLNEVLPNPKGGEDSEFIELFNGDDGKRDISWWGLRDGSGATYIFPPGTNIEMGSFLVIMKTQFGFSLNNSDETVDLLDARGNIVDTMTYKTSKEGVSWAFDGARWRAGLTLTPGGANIFNGEPDIVKSEVPEKAYKKVYAYFNAKAKDGDGDEVKYRWDFGDGHKSYKQKTKHKYEEEGEYTVTLRIDDGREPIERVFALKVEEYPKRKLRIVAFEPNPKGKDTEGEWARVKNFDKKTVDITGWSIATGKDKKHLTNHPIADGGKIKSGKELVITRETAKLTLDNKRGMVVLRSPDGKTVQEIKYKKEDGAQEGEVYFKEKGKKWQWKEIRKQASLVEEDNEENEKELSMDMEEGDWVDPVFDELVGESSQEESAFLSGGILQIASITPRVLGAHDLRLRTEEERYIFTTTYASEHWSMPLWRSFKGKIKNMF